MSGQQACRTPKHLPTLEDIGLGGHRRCTQQGVQPGNGGGGHVGRGGMVFPCEPVSGNHNHFVLHRPGNKYSLFVKLSVMSGVS